MTAEKTPHPEKPVSEDTILKVTKEVAIKFIEVGRLPPSNFNETFRDLYVGIKSTAYALTGPVLPLFEMGRFSGISQPGCLDAITP